jgi:hypothetical protein
MTRGTHHTYSGISRIDAVAVGDRVRCVVPRQLNVRDPV